MLADGVKATQLGAHAATLAEVRVDDGDLPPGEGMSLAHLGREDQLQVGGVHIGVHQHNAGLPVAGRSQVGKSGRHTGLAGAALAAENDDLFHRFSLTIAPIRAYRSRNRGTYAGRIWVRGLPRAIPSAMAGSSGIRINTGSSA